MARCDPLCAPVAGFGDGGLLGYARLQSRRQVEAVCPVPTSHSATGSVANLCALRTCPPVFAGVALTVVKAANSVAAVRSNTVVPRIRKHLVFIFVVTDDRVTAPREPESGDWCVG